MLPTSSEAPPIPTGMQIYAFRLTLQASELSDHPPVRPVFSPTLKITEEAGFKFSVAVSRRWKPR